MTWQAFHHRGETLRAVVDAADERRDGVLPLDVPGAVENFADELDLVSALLLKWHARLSGNIERAMVREPMDLASAVATAWRTTAEQMPGVRLVVDGLVEQPLDAEMAAALDRARQREWIRLALAAGLANSPSAAAVEAGRRIEEQAREELHLPRRAPVETPAAPAAEKVERAELDRHEEAARRESANTSLVDRIKAVLAA